MRYGKTGKGRRVQLNTLTPEYDRGILVGHYGYILDDHCAAVLIFIPRRDEDIEADRLAKQAA